METKKAGETTGHLDVYALVTNQIIEQLNKGTVPWHKPWIESGIPKNLVSQRPYRGINVMLLAMAGYELNFFLTFRQLKEMGGTVKKGEKAHTVVYWNFMDKEVEGEAAKKKVSFLRYYSVFNVAQCEGIVDHLIPFESHDHEPLIDCEKIIAHMPQCPLIQHKEQKAWYNPINDVVNMPKKRSFKSSEAYYATLFHELVHSTGHVSRLNRKDLIQMAEFGSEPYSHEELVAEIGACYLQSLCGICSELEQSAAYIQHWISKLENDKRFIFSASTHAQKATDFILNVHPEVDEVEEKESTENKSSSEQVS